MLRSLSIRNAFPKGARGLLASGLLATALACGQEEPAASSSGSGSPPQAGFSTSTSAPISGQSVQFTDTSTGDPTSWVWHFGDGATSSLRNPAHTFQQYGTYTVTLAASNGAGAGTASRAFSVAASGSTLAYAVVDTGLTASYSDTGILDPAPAPGAAYFGQDGQVGGLPFAYKDNGDGTVSDLNTGLMWVQARGSKVSWADAVSGASTCSVGSYGDWRMPTIKELYSLADFGRGRMGQSAADSIPYLDTQYFEFKYGNNGTAIGDRFIDCQDWSADKYVGQVMGGIDSVAGFNFSDGRIKSYPLLLPPDFASDHTLYVRYVRGNAAYGKNDYADPGDGTITDRATGLMWTREDSGAGLNWKEALAYVQARNAANHLGHSDWRLPNAKELHSLVDYSRAPMATDAARRGPALDPRFTCTSILAEDKATSDYPSYWSSSTFLEGANAGGAAIYIAFGRAFGWMETSTGSGVYQLLDVHGAGAQRSDPKAGDPSAYPHGFGPQGDVVRIYNFVRLVRNAS